MALKFDHRFSSVTANRVNPIRITKSINLLYFCTVLGVCCDVETFKRTARAYSPLIEKGMHGVVIIDHIHSSVHGVVIIHHIHSSVHGVVIIDHIHSSVHGVVIIHHIHSSV